MGSSGRRSAVNSGGLTTASADLGNVAGVVGRFGLTDVTPVVGSTASARVPGARRRRRARAGLARRCSARGTTPSAASVVLRDATGRKKAVHRMTPGAPGTDRWHADGRPRPARPVDVRRRGVERPDVHLAPRRHRQDRGRAGQPRTSPTTSRPAPGCSTSWPARLPQAPSGPRATAAARVAARHHARRRAPRRAGPGRLPAGAGARAPGPRVGHRLPALPAVGRPAARAVRLLVRVLPALDRRRAGRRPGRPGPTGPARHVQGRDRAPGLRRLARLRRRLPAADPPDRRGQPQGPEQHPRRGVVGRRLAVGDRLARRRPRRHPPGARHDGRLHRARRRAPRSSAWRSRSTSRCSARPTTRGSTAHPEWFTTKPDGTIAYAENPPKKYQDIYPLNFDNDPTGLYAECLRIVRHWIAAGVTHLPGRQPAHQAAELLAVADRRGEQDRPGRAVPRRGVHPAGDDARAGARSASTRATPTSPGARRRTSSRPTSSELAESSALHAAELLRQHPGHPARVPAVHGGPAAFAIRAVLAADAVADLGRVLRLRALRAPAGTPGSEEYLDSEKYQLRPRDFAAAIADGRSLAPLHRQAQPDPPRAPGAAAAAQRPLPPVDNPDITAFSKRDAASGDTVLVVCTVNPHEWREATVAPRPAALGV